jgi:hypothetical protein
MTPVSPPMVNSPMKPDRAEHRRVELDRALVHRRRPVEDLDCRRHATMKLSMEKTDAL